MTAAVFHPVLRELRLEWRNHVRNAFAAWAETLFHLGAFAALAVLLGTAWSYVDGDRIGLVLADLMRFPLPILVALALVAFVAVRASVIALHRELTLGWWSAIPVRPGATSRTLALAALAVAGLMLAVLYGALGLIALVSDFPGRWTPAAMKLAAIGTGIGTVAGWFAARRALAHPAGDDTTRGRGTPLYPPGFVARSDPPYLPRWQRIETLRRWRRAGGEWQFLLFGLVIPANEGRLSLAGLLLFGIVAIWAGTALRASGDVLLRAFAALAATPLRLWPLARAGARYPGLALALGRALGAIGLAMQQAPWPFVVGFALVFAAVAVLDFALILRWRANPRTARIRLGVDLALVAAAAQLAFPLAALAWAALTAWHLSRVGERA